jgi:hypothetical protein
MTWAKHVACMGRNSIHIGFWRESQKERDHSEDPDVSRIIIRWCLEKYHGELWTGIIWLRIGTE